MSEILCHSQMDAQFYHLIDNNYSRTFDLFFKILQPSEAYELCNKKNVKIES